MTLVPTQPTATSAVRFATRLAEHGDRPALLGPEGDLTYAALAACVDAAAQALGPVRRLVLVAAANAVDPVVTYLAALAAGHPVLLMAGDRPVLEAMTAAYDPDVAAAGPAGWTLRERRPAPPTTCTRTSPCCSAPPGPPARRSSSAFPGRISSPTRRRSARPWASAAPTGP